jgi:hypothetical protein
MRLTWPLIGRTEEMRTLEPPSRLRLCPAFLFAERPARAKELIDDALRTAPPQARTYIDAFLTIYWFAMDQPEGAVQASKNVALEDIPVVGAEIAWVLAPRYPRTRDAPPKPWLTPTRGTASRLALSTLRP